MDYALRVNDDLYIVRRDAEKVHRLDKFKSLVHHRRRVHGDLCAHAPVRVLHRLFGGDGHKLAPRLSSEWSAGACEQYAFKLTLPASHKTLKDGGMFRIHGDYLGTVQLCRRHDETARTNKRLFICKGYPLFRLYRRKRRL